MVRGNDAFQRGLNDLLRRSRNYVEMKIVTVRQGVERARKQRDIVLQANALTCLDQVRAPHMPELWVVQNQVAQFCALLDKVHVR